MTILVLSLFLLGLQIFSISGQEYINSPPDRYFLRGQYYPSNNDNCPPCLCEQESPTYTVSYENCPGGNYSPDCEPTITRGTEKYRRHSTHAHSNVNTNVNSNKFRRSGTRSTNSNTNVNTNKKSDDVEIDGDEAAILLNELGLLDLGSSKRRSSHSLSIGSHSNNQHRRNHGNVIVRTHGNNLEVIGDSGEAEVQEVEYFDDVEPDYGSGSGESNAKVIVTARRNVGHHNHHQHHHH